MPIKSVITTERLPIKMWLEENDIEDEALAQAKNAANLPFTFKHIAMMPDAHVGYGINIGGVVATTSDVIIPNCIGVDIGCGMCAIKTNITVDNLDTDILKSILGNMRERIPVGVGKNRSESLESLMPDFDIDKNGQPRNMPKNSIVEKEWSTTITPRLRTLRMTAWCASCRWGWQCLRRVQSECRLCPTPTSAGVC